MEEKKDALKRERERKKGSPNFTSNLRAKIGRIVYLPPYICQYLQI
jgi:hypothetical protein